ncbi:hypothetical protein RRG08_054415 [Elysia crispata]|uniref:Uncharacterized protein n=1 Tax=Elysia crispata TaxID=231223 RepID=A0AAE1E5B1_9GAST|nr:hypothetical protein RRG08_054415 [Elysia crispata]
MVSLIPALYGLPSPSTGHSTVCDSAGRLTNGVRRNCRPRGHLGAEHAGTAAGWRSASPIFFWQLVRRSLEVRMWSQQHEPF